MCDETLSTAGFVSKKHIFELKTSIFMETYRNSYGFHWVDVLTSWGKHIPTPATKVQQVTTMLGPCGKKLGDRQERLRVLLDHEAEARWIPTDQHGKPQLEGLEGLEGFVTYPTSTLPKNDYIK